LSNTADKEEWFNKVSCAENVKGNRRKNKNTKRSEVRRDDNQKVCMQKSAA
jgi:hypothetical protein